MTIRARYSLSFAVSSTSAEEKDLGNAKWEVVSDSPNEGGVRKNVVVASAVDVELNMASVASAKLLIVRTSPKDPTEDPVEIRVRRNNITAEQIAIVPLTGTKEGHFLLSTTGLTSLYASNMGTVDMDVTLVLVGD